ncbi:unannotated protein [freshwater metagenome]|uniref:Unannotated protein n=1 Tax=freshwater metagenome TaxID=449393 RepID=A0A6J6FVL6_9ZZZZ
MLTWWAARARVMSWTMPGRSAPTRSSVRRVVPATGSSPAAPRSTVTSRRPSAPRGRSAATSASAESSGTETTTMPANLPARRAIWLRSQLPP